MGVITISIDEKTEKELRMLASLKFNKEKGRLSAVITEALKEWSSKKEQENLVNSLELLEKGINLGGLISKKKEDLHKR